VAPQKFATTTLQAF